MVRTFGQRQRDISSARLGAAVWAINTVQVSNHTGYGDWTGAVYSGQSVRELVDGIAARGTLSGAMRS